MSKTFYSSSRKGGKTEAITNYLDSLIGKTVIITVKNGKEEHYSPPFDLDLKATDLDKLKLLENKSK